MAILLITHNLGVVAQFAQDVIVMYASRIVERASVPQLFAAPSIRIRGPCCVRCRRPARGKPGSNRSRARFLHP